MLQRQLELLSKEFNTLKLKIKNKLEQDKQTIAETTQKLNETSHKLELTAKENSENEKVLEQLLKEFKELENSL
jgi:seryl-tRNA synthetase